MQEEEFQKCIKMLRNLPKLLGQKTSLIFLSFPMLIKI